MTSNLIFTLNGRKTGYKNLLNDQLFTCLWVFSTFFEYAGQVFWVQAPIRINPETNNATKTFFMIFKLVPFKQF